MVGQRIAFACLQCVKITDFKAWFSCCTIRTKFQVCFLCQLNRGFSFLQRKTILIIISCNCCACSNNIRNFYFISIRSQCRAYCHRKFHILIPVCIQFNFTTAFFRLNVRRVLQLDRGPCSWETYFSGSLICFFAGNRIDLEVCIERLVFHIRCIFKIKYQLHQAVFIHCNRTNINFRIMIIRVLRHNSAGF